jgi:hypothetical protein
MPFFTKRFHIDQFGDFDFVFTRIYAPDKEYVRVSVFDGKTKVCRFTMQPVLHYWMIADAKDLPIWIGGIEMELEKAIKEHHFSAAK